MRKAQDKQAEKFPGKFYPWFFMRHWAGDAFSFMLSDPGKYSL